MATDTLSPASCLARLPPAQREAFLRELSLEQCAALEHDWHGFWARPSQRTPSGLWTVWLILAGRGFGKSRTGAEQVLLWARQPGVRIALVAETAADCRDVMIEGESGILACAPPGQGIAYEPSKRRVSWPNGSMATTYSGDSPDQLRGPQHHYAWCDELAKFQYAQDTWDNLELGLRLGDDPRVVVTTTPRPIPVLRMLLADPRTVVTRGNTYENAVNLAPSFRDRILARYEGTRLGRQEIYAELLDDAPGALWTRDILDRTRVHQLPPLMRILVGVDPGHDAGIVVAGLGEDGEGYIVDDLSVSGAPLTWAQQAVSGYHRWRANRLVVEKNHGGEMVETTIKTVDARVAVQTVWASQGKYARAEPVSALYEQGRVHHVGLFAAMEDELCLAGDTLIATATGPQRLDQVQAGTLVYTRQGYKPVLWSGLTHASAAVARILTVNGRYLIATARHPVYTIEHGFVPTMDLQPGDTLRTVWHAPIKRSRSMAPLSCGAGAAGSSTIEATTWTAKDASCIERYGRRPMGLFLPVSTSTTATATSATMPWRTWRPSTLASISPCTLARGLPADPPRNAVPKPSSIGNTLWSMHGAAPGAGLPLPPPDLGPCFAPAHAAVDTIASIEAISTPRPVYNLMVAGAQEYFANGILVHNCTWVPGEGLPSPNRLDALVWALSALMLGPAPPPLVGVGGTTQRNPWWGSG